MFKFSNNGHQTIFIALTLSLSLSPSLEAFLRRTAALCKKIQNTIQRFKRWQQRSFHKTRFQNGAIQVRACFQGADTPFSGLFGCGSDIILSSEISAVGARRAIIYRDIVGTCLRLQATYWYRSRRLETACFCSLVVERSTDAPDWGYKMHSYFLLSLI